jgi:GTP-binding protein
MTGPIVAIVGRPNVGKSTLLNRLVDRRVAVVADLPGTTRDRLFAFVSWQGRELTVVDTGGWQGKPQGSLEKKVRRQVDAAVAQADVIIFLVDVKEGAIGADEEIADLLRAANKPAILAVNKVDSAKQANQVPDFYRLGMGEPIAISAHHNLGIDDLMNAVSACLPPQSVSVVEAAAAKVAIVGRPNVGKSTLLNALLGQERAIVDESPGTTRDSLDAVIDWGGRRMVLIDTAGIKRRGRVGAGVDYYSVLRALQAVNRCDVALLLIDAGEFITAQDMHIAGYIIDAGKGLILLVNKWDLVPQEQRERFKQSLERRLRFASYMPIMCISAKLGQGVGRILPLAWEVCRERQRQIPRAEVDELVKQVVNSYPPPRSGSRRLHIARAYQDESQAATFILEVNDPKLVHFSYQRYLENRLRQRFGFRGVPVKLIFARAARKINKRTNVKAQ